MSYYLLWYGELTKTSWKNLNTENAELALAYVKVKGLQGWEHLSGMSKIKRAVDSRQHNHRMDILCNINGHAYISTLQKDREKSKVEASDI